MTDVPVQLMLPLLIAVPAGEAWPTPEWEPSPSREEVVAERILELVREEQA
jgi:hypothetical protein